MKCPFPVAGWHLDISFCHVVWILRVCSWAPILPGSGWVLHTAPLPPLLPGSAQWLLWPGNRPESLPLNNTIRWLKVSIKKYFYIPVSIQHFIILTISTTILSIHLPCLRIETNPHFWKLKTDLIQPGIAINTISEKEGGFAESEQEPSFISSSWSSSSLRLGCPRLTSRRPFRARTCRLLFWTEEVGWGTKVGNPGS